MTVVTSRQTLFKIKKKNFKHILVNLKFGYLEHIRIVIEKPKWQTVMTPFKIKKKIKK